MPDVQYDQGRVARLRIGTYRAGTGGEVRYLCNLADKLWADLREARRQGGRDALAAEVARLEKLLVESGRRELIVQDDNERLRGWLEQVPERYAAMYKTYTNNEAARQAGAEWDELLNEIDAALEEQADA